MRLEILYNDFLIEEQPLELKLYLFKSKNAFLINEKCKVLI